MGDVLQFPKPAPDREKARLIREARSRYESIFPSEPVPVRVMPEPPAGS